MFDLRNLLTFGSPHQGQFGVPRCDNTTSKDLTAEFCLMIAKLLSEGAYNQHILDMITVAQYWHDPLDRQVKQRKIITSLVHSHWSRIIEALL